MKKEIGSYEVESAINTIYECLLGEDGIYKGMPYMEEKEEMKKAFVKITKRLHDFIGVGHFEAAEVRIRHRIRKPLFE